MANPLTSIRDWFRSRPIYDAGQAQRTSARDLNDPMVKRTRMYQGGQLRRPGATPVTPYMDDLDAAILAADTGMIGEAAQLLQACDQDAVIKGLMATRTSGLTRLPVKWNGDPQAVSILKSGVIQGLDPAVGNVMSLYDYLVPPTELSRFAEDAIKLGVAIGELQPSTSGLPLFRYLDPVGLQYRVDTGVWVYNSLAGPIVVDPGVWPDNRSSAFVLYTAGRTAPWRRGIWQALVRSYIVALYALNYRSAWESKLANPAIVAKTPVGSDVTLDNKAFQDLAAWGVNSVFLLPNGIEASILQSNGIGYQSFSATIKEMAEQVIYLISGNTVVADGGSGFQNASLFRAIRGDLIQADANALAYVENYQILPLILESMGMGDRAVTREYITTPPAELNNEAQVFTQVATAITNLTQALAPQRMQLDVAALCSKFNIPIAGDQNNDGVPDDQQSAPLQLPVPVPEEDPYDEVSFEVALDETTPLEEAAE